MFDAFYDVEEKMKKGNPYAKKVRRETLMGWQSGKFHHPFVT